VITIAEARRIQARQNQPPPAPAPPTVNGPDGARALTFKGLGTWWDVYDWSPTFTRGAAPLGVGDVDRIANSGVQTLYIQTATYRHPDTVLDPALLGSIVARAHARNMKVVGWYLPQFLDVNFEVNRMATAIRMGLDGYGIDIESTDNANVAARSAALLAETRQLRALFPTTPLASVPVTPVIWEQLNTSWWPSFPYREMAQMVDVWMPMAYSTYRAAGSEWHDPYRYVSESVTRLRTLTGMPGLQVHPIGGLASLMSNADVDAMGRAMTDTSSIGGSLYDDVSTPAGLWPSLSQFRRT